MEYNLMAIILAPVWILLTILSGLISWTLNRGVTSSPIRGRNSLLVALGALSLALGAFFIQWGRQWWTYTVPEPAGVLIMGVLPLTAIAAYVWKRPEASAARVLAMSASFGIAAAVTFFTLGLVLGAPSG